MPQFQYELPIIELEVADQIYNDTVVKQKARFMRFGHNQEPGNPVTKVIVKVFMYASDNGSYGELLTGPGFRPYEKTLQAANDTIVKVPTGEVVAIRNSESDAHWQALMDLHPDQVMLQGDFFVMLRETQEIKIGDLIRLHNTQANALGRFNA